MKLNLSKLKKIAKGAIIGGAGVVGAGAAVDTGMIQDASNNEVLAVAWAISILINVARKFFNGGLN